MGHKVCTELEDALFLKFKEGASHRRQFSRGYISQALRHAVLMYIWFNETHSSYEEMVEIAEKEHPDMDFQDLIKIVFEECKELYIEKNKEV